LVVSGNSGRSESVRLAIKRPVHAWKLLAPESTEDALPLLVVTTVTVESDVLREHVAEEEQLRIGRRPDAHRQGVLDSIFKRGSDARRQADRPTAREQIEMAKAGHSARRDSARHAPRPGRASTTAVDETQHMAALLDNKAERLELLLAEAEHVIARLERAMGADAERPNAGHGALLNDEDSSLRQQPSAPADPLTRSVYELADAGHDSVEIAQQLDEQVGKIDLILALRR
jgi:hypothetical protein